MLIPFYREKDLVEAVKRFKQVVSLRPDHFDANLGLGIDLIPLGQTDLAIKHLHLASATRPLDHRPYRRLGNVLSSLGRFDEAINTSTFTSADLVFSGTATGTPSYVITKSGDDTNFKVELSGLTGDGTAILSIALNTVQDPAGNNNETGRSCCCSANALPICYDVVFSEAIDASTFATGDLSFSGTATGTPSYVITNSGDDTNFKVELSGLTGDGTALVSIALNTVQDPAGNNNTASTSTDNSVTYDTAGPRIIRYFRYRSTNSYRGTRIGRRNMCGQSSGSHKHPRYLLRRCFL